MEFSPEEKQAIEEKLQKEEIVIKEERTLPVVKIEHGQITAETLEGGLRYATMLYKSGMLPKHYDSAAKVLTAMQMAKDLKLPPVIALKNICVINGSPSIWGDLPLGLVRKSYELEYITEKLYTEDGEEIGPFTKKEPFTAVCTVKRKGYPNDHTTWFSISDAKKAGLYGKSGPWTSYTKRMLQMRARSQALKDVFPDILLGLGIAEYDHNVMPSESEQMDVTPQGIDKSQNVQNYKDIMGELSDKINKSVQEN